MPEDMTTEVAPTKVEPTENEASDAETLNDDITNDESIMDEAQTEEPSGDTPTDLKFGDDVAELDRNILGAAAKELNLNQEQVNKIQEIIKQHADEHMKKSQDEHMEKLGEDGKKSLEDVLKWGDDNLTEEERKAFDNMLTSAESVRILDKLTKGGGGSDAKISKPAPKKAVDYREKMAEKDAAGNYKFLADPDFIHNL